MPSPSQPPSPDGPLDGDRIVVVGAGMTAHRLVAGLRTRDPEGTWSVTVIGDEPHEPYDRVHLSEWFDARDVDALTLDRAVWDDPRVTLVTGDAVASLDRTASVVTTRSGRQV
ncbi:MAG: nitrite reductase (NAD(P)H), partial [Cellulosimicrobium funkei]